MICISIVLGIVNLKRHLKQKKNCNQQKITCPTKKKPFLKMFEKIIKTNLSMYLKVPSHLLLRPLMVGVLTP